MLFSQVRSIFMPVYRCGAQADGCDPIVEGLSSLWAGEQGGNFPNLAVNIDCLSEMAGKVEGRYGRAAVNESALLAGNRAFGGGCGGDGDIGDID